MRVVGDRAKHRPDDGTAQRKGARLVDAVPQDGRNLFAACFDMVGVRNGFFREIRPLNRTVRLEGSPHSVVRAARRRVIDEEGADR